MKSCNKCYWCRVAGNNGRIFTYYCKKDKHGKMFFPRLHGWLCKLFRGNWEGEE